MSVFLLDTNFFIQAHRSIYPLDVAPSFWKKVKELAAQGKIISIDKVKAEIYKNEDELKAWCKDELPPDFFKDSTTVLNAYAQVVNWAMSKKGHYQQRALNEFLDADEADAWLVAYALEHGLSIVTYEVSEPNTKKKIKIPEACIPFSISFVNTIEMLRMLRERF